MIFNLRSRRGFAVTLALVVLLGGFLRLHELGAKGLWADELFTLGMAHYHPLLPEAGEPVFRRVSFFEVSDQHSFLTAKAAEQSPPLQDLLEKFSIQFLGPTEWGARLPSALVSCALLLFVAWRAWRASDPWWRSVQGWLLLFLALSPTLVVYAREGRAYSLGASLLCAGGLLWLTRWQNGWRAVPPPGWGEIALFTLACYAHYNAAALVAVLLAADAVVGTIKRSGTTWVRLVTLGALFLVWVVMNAHTIGLTAAGGLGWNRPAHERVFDSWNGAKVIVYMPWLALLALTGAVAALLMVRARRAHQPTPLAGRSLRLLAIVALVTFVHVTIVGKMVSAAGMGHPRYYLFGLPLLLFAFAVLVTALPRWWLQAGVGVLAAALAVPHLRNSPFDTREDFRPMAAAAMRGAQEGYVILYTWRPNRDFYRLYLERYAGQDLRQRMIGISNDTEVQQTCAQLGSARQVVVVSHVIWQQLVDKVYQACGANWPARAHESFPRYTLTEHWQAALPTGTVKP